jgi:hypothetical protein
MATRLERLQARRIDPGILSKGLYEVYAKMTQSEAVQYAIGAMQPVEPEYTQNTKDQGERVKNQLIGRLTESCDYRYQGSVTNDTHIRARSDIDLLVLTKKFTQLAPPQVATSPYQGDPLQDLKTLRLDIIGSLRAVFPTATVDSTGKRSVPIEGGSLTRKVDVVPANWYDSTVYTQYKQEVVRGVQVLDLSIPDRVLNTPFLHNYWIDTKDTKVSGGLRKAARLMKSLKYDAATVDLASYDIAAIAYSMDDQLLMVSRGHDLQLVENCRGYCQMLLQNPAYRNGLDVPDGSRRIFTAGHATEAGLRQLAGELEKLSNDILTQNARSFRKLAEARVEY